MNKNQIECYKHPFVLKEIRQAVESVFTHITNVAMIEEEIMVDIGRYLLQGGENFKHRRFLRRRIYQGVSKAVKRTRKQYTIPLADLSSSNEEGQAVEYEPADTLASVESDLIVKETITLLAKDDRRKEFVLNAWADGYTDDTEISHILADVFTGQATGHLSFIKRFRKSCRTELTAQAI